MRKFLKEFWVPILVTALLFGSLGTSPTFHIAAQQTTVSGPTGNDPCFSAAKSSVVVNITTATTTQLVALAAGKSIYVCGYLISMVGTTTANTVVFEYGTGATCGTGTTALSGVISSGVLTNGATVLSAPGGGTEMATPQGNALCILSTVATGPSIAGYVTYVQL